MAVNLPPCPASLRPIAHYLKTAQEHDLRDPVVAYWSRLYALQSGLRLSTKQAEETNLLIGIMTWLEVAKKEHLNNEAITNEVVAQAYLENYALKLFTYADQQDRASNFGKNVVKAFYSAGMIYDVLLTFGELSIEAQKNSKYAKWKAAYIHNCLKNGETPQPGPMVDQEESAGDDVASGIVDNNDEESAVQPQPLPRQQPVDQPWQPPSSGDSTQLPPPVYDPNMLPSPPVDPEPKNPGGFQPYLVPAQTPFTTYDPAGEAAGGSKSTAADFSLTPDQLVKAQKYCKWAGSALNYDDIKTAIENLQKGLRLLQTGQDS